MQGTTGSSCAAFKMIFPRCRRSLQVDSAKAALTDDAQRMEGKGKEARDKVKGQQVPIPPP